MDVRFGLIEHGPVDFSFDRTKSVKVGVIGSSVTVDGLREWFRRCEGSIPAKVSRQPNLFPAFPGIGIGGPFRCWFEIDDQHQRVLSTSTVSAVVRELVDEKAIKKAVEVFLEEVRDLSQLDRPPQVIVCALPIEIIERVKNLQKVEDEGDEDTGEDNSDAEEEAKFGLYEDFRGALKAASMAMKIPI